MSRLLNVVFLIVLSFLAGAAYQENKWDVHRAINRVVLRSCECSYCTCNEASE